MGDESEKGLEVNLVGDYRETVPNDVMLVECDKDYVKACQEIIRYESNGNKKAIWVKNQFHYTWLKNFVDQVGVSCKFQEKTARLILADTWNLLLPLPDWLEDGDVLKQNLLKLDIPNASPRIFSERILSYLISPVFECASLDENNLSEILESLVKDSNLKFFSDYPILHRCLQEICNNWVRNTKLDWVKDICNQLPNGANGLWKQLSAWSILNGYPSEMLEFVLTPKQVQFVQSVPSGALQGLSISQSIREQILTQIRLFFKRTRSEEVTTSKDFQKVLDRTSGRLSEEFKQVTALLKSNQFEPEQNDIERIKEKFKTCSGVSEIQLKQLEYHIKPKKPNRVELDDKWNKEEWIGWTIDEYLPYRTWQIHAKQYDPEVEEDVKRFSEWYDSEYVSIQQDPGWSLALVLNNIAQNWDDALVVIAVVDCLPISFMELVDDSLISAGFSRHEMSYRFSALPTVTEHNKPQMLSGQWSIKKNKPYESILTERVQADWRGRNVLYASNLKGLLEIEMPTKPATIVLNLVDGDKSFHEDMEAKNTTHEEELGRLYVRMAEALHKMANEWIGPQVNFHVHVVTDHGACRILKKEKTSFDSKIVNRLFDEEKYRFATISEDRAGEIPQNLWDLGFRFKPPFEDTDTVFFIPKGHNTVRSGMQAGGYTHGGATPEEVIVPVALYKPVKLAWASPAWRFIDLDWEKGTSKANFFIQRVTNVDLKIQNPNSSEIRILRASILLPADTDLKECGKPVVPARGEAVLTLNCYFQNSALTQSQLEIEITYEISGENHTILVSLESKFKSAMSTGFSIKDL